MGIGVIRLLYALSPCPLYKWGFMWNSNNHEKGAMAMLAVMLLLSAAIFFIFNITSRLDSVLSFKAFLDKNSEIKKITKEIEEILSNPTSCKDTLIKMGKKVNIVRDGGNIIFGPPSNPGSRDSIYKQVKLKNMESELKSSTPTGPSNQGRGILKIKFTTSANLNKIIEKKSIGLWVETQNLRIKSCSTAPPAHGSLNCEPIKAEIACCLFTYYINIPYLDLLTTNNQISINGFEKITRRGNNAFKITLDPKKNAQSYAPKEALGLLVNPSASNSLMRNSTFKTKSERQKAIDLRIKRCKKSNKWNKMHTGTLELKCERGAWTWEGNCDDHP